ncbi:MAG: hypothetical protein J6T92_03445 [Ottowia sp.]|nr:hypothetical protein [Ottowia sp.]
MNLFRAFERLLPRRPLEIGTVRGRNASGLLVELPSGNTLRVRGEATTGQRIFIRDGAAEGPAPTLPVTYIEV